MDLFAVGVLLFNLLWSVVLAERTWRVRTWEALLNDRERAMDNFD